MINDESPSLQPSCVFIIRISLMELITKPTHLNCLILRKYLSEKFLVRIVLPLRWKVPPVQKAIKWNRSGWSSDVRAKSDGVKYNGRRNGVMWSQLRKAAGTHKHFCGKLSNFQKLFFRYLRMALVQRHMDYCGCVNRELAPRIFYAMPSRVSVRMAELYIVFTDNLCWNQ